MNMQISIANAIGADFMGLPNYITESFINRVIADGGTFEAQYCLFNTLYGLSKISYTPPPLFDPAAIEFISATGITEELQQQAINNLVKGLKADGLWSKMKAVYPFVTDNRNLLSYSEQFNDGAWTKASITVTANTTTAPDGTLTADKIIATNTASTTRAVYQSFNSVLGSIYTTSVYVKAAEYTKFAICEIGNGRFAASFDLINQTATVIGGSSYISSIITDVGNGWFRCSVIANGSIQGWAVAFVGYPDVGATTSSSGVSYAGDGTSGIFIWGAQLELGSTASTYQPMLGSAQAYITNQFKYNLVNPVDSDAAFRLVFNGGWTHSSNGATPNGTNGYADTKLVPSSVLSTSNYSLGFYSRTDVNGSYTQMGSNSLFQIYARLGNAIYYDVMYPSRITVTNASSLGLFNFSRTTLNRVDGYKNGVNIGNDTTTVSSLPNDVLRVGAGYTYSPNELAYAYVSNGLTDTEAANLYTRVQAFQTALNRQV